MRKRLGGVLRASTGESTRRRRSDLFGRTERGMTHLCDVESEGDYAGGRFWLARPPSGSALGKGNAAQGVEVGGSGDLQQRAEDVSVGAPQMSVEGEEEE